MDLPLYNSGSDIFIWDNDGIRKELYHIPFGTFLIRRSDVYHSGHARGKGNLRLHLYICHNAADNRLRYPNDMSLVSYDTLATKDHKVDFTIDEKKTINILDHSEAIERLAKENIENINTEHYFLYNGKLEDTFSLLDVAETVTRKLTSSNIGNVSNKRQKQNNRGKRKKTQNIIISDSDDIS